jgi:hypothetical protein
MGYCTYGDATLYDVVNGDLEPPRVEGPEDEVTGGSLEYQGLHINAVTDGSYVVQVDGHVGQVMQFDADEYDDALELVDDLNRVVMEVHHYRAQDDEDELVEWAGRKMTHDPERAEDDDNWIHIPRL